MKGILDRQTILNMSQDQLASVMSGESSAHHYKGSSGSVVPRKSASVIKVIPSSSAKKNESFGIH